MKDKKGVLPHPKLELLDNDHTKGYPYIMARLLHVFTSTCCQIPITSPTLFFSESLRLATCWRKAENPHPLTPHPTS